MQNCIPGTFFVQRQVADIQFITRVPFDKIKHARQALDNTSMSGIVPVCIWRVKSLNPTKP